MTENRCEEAGDLTGQEPKEAIKILEALKNVMDPKDQQAKELYDWLKYEIRKYQELAAGGASEYQLDGFFEANIFNILEEIKYGYIGYGVE